MAEQYNPMLLGSLPEDEGSPVNPLSLAGLGGAAAFQGMFPFASEPTASNIIGRNLPAGGVNPQVTGPVSQGLFQSSNIIGRNLPAGGANPQVTGPVSQGSLRPVPNQPVLIGQPQSYQGVLTGPNTPPQFTGTNTGRLTPGNQIVPQTQVATINQPPAVKSSGSLSAKTTTAKPGTANYAVNRTSPYTMGPAKQFASGLFKAGAIGALTTPNTMADTTLGGAYERRVAAGEDPDQVRQSLGLASDYREMQPLSGADLELANQYAAAYAAEQAGSEAVASPPQNALLDLAERENALGPKMTDIFSGRAEALSAPTENPIDVTSSGSFASTSNQPQMSRLGDEPLVFNAPTGPSSTATQAAQIAATLPDDSGLMGAPGIQGTGIPTTTLNIDGGSVTVPQALADPTFQTLNPMKEAEQGSPQAIFETIRAKGALSPELIAAGQARAEAMGTTFDPETGFSRDAYLAGQADPGPMGRDATRARLGGMTLNQYLNAPDGAVSGLRTDPQGRMIPAGAPGTSQTRADAYGQYEDEVSQAYQRQSDRMQQLADQRDGTAGPRTYGGYTTSQLRGMVGGGDNLRAAQMRAEAGLNPVTGNRESTEEQNQLQTDVLKARLAKLKEQDPDKLSKAESYADRLNLQGDARTAFIFSQMGTSMDDVFGLEGTGAGGGGGRTFATEEEAIASGVKGKVTIGGRPAVI
jgi:hypothetical protein